MLAWKININEFNQTEYYECVLRLGVHEDCGVFERLTKLDEEFPGANIILHKTGKLPEVLIIP